MRRPHKEKCLEMDNLAFQILAMKRKIISEFSHTHSALHHPPFFHSQAVIFLNLNWMVPQGLNMRELVFLSRPIGPWDEPPPLLVHAVLLPPMLI